MDLIGLGDHVRNVVVGTHHQLRCICDLGRRQEALIDPDLLDKSLHHCNHLPEPCHHSFRASPVFELGGHLAEDRLEQSSSVIGALGPI